MTVLTVEVPQYQVEFSAEVQLLVFPVSVWMIDTLAEQVAVRSVLRDYNQPLIHTEELVKTRKQYLLRLAFHWGLIPERFLEKRSA